jgi:hypothetical protein
VSRAPLTVQRIAVETPSFGDFLVSAKTPFVLDSTASREVTITFSPQMVGARSAHLDIVTDGVQQLTVLALSGTGVLGEALFHPASLDFGDVGVGSSSTLPITFTSSATDPAYIQVGTPQGADGTFFSESTSGAITIPANSTLVVNVTFRPERTGPFNSYITAQPCPSCQTQSVPITGNGIAADLTVAPNPVTFPMMEPGQKATQTVVVTNHGTRRATISPAVLGPGSDSSFSVGASAPVVLAQNDTVSFIVTWAPVQTNAVSASLRIPTDDTGTPVLIVPISGEAIGPAINVAPPALGFPQMAAGLSVLKDIAVQNIGLDPNNTLPLVISSVTITPGPFTIDFPAPPISLEPGRETHVNVTYTPTMRSTDTATITILSNDPVHPTVTVPVTGSAKPAVPCTYTVVPPNLDFGSVIVGANVELDFQLQNTSGYACTFANLGLTPTSSTAFAVTGFSSRTIDPGQSMTIPVEFSPTSGATFTGTITFQADSTTAPVGNVALTGSGAPGCFTVQPQTLDFGQVGLMCGAPQRQVQLANSCPVTVNVSKSYVGPGPSKAYSVAAASAGAITLAPGQTALVSVIYTPTSVGTDTNALYVQTDFQPAPYLVPLTGQTVAVPSNTDTFTEPPIQQVDVLWIIDNSGSMSNKQAQLAANASRFIQKAVSSGMDFHVAVTTTGITPFTGGIAQCPGGANGGEAGRFFPVDNSSPRILTPQTPNVEQVFAKDAIVGICHYIEEGMTAMYDALSPPLVNDTQAPGSPWPSDGNAGFLRSTARLYVIWVTDEDDMVPSATSPIGKVPNPTPVQYYVSFLEGLKPGRPDMVGASAIIGLPGSCGGDIDGVGTRYIDFVEQVGGEIEDVCSADWSAVIDAVANDAFSQQLDFPLSEDALGRNVTVTVNGVTVPATSPSGQVNWTFNPTIGNYGAVVFTSNDPPGPNAVVTITYNTPCPMTVP